MSERDELAGRIQQASTVVGRGIANQTAWAIADALLAAGYIKPKPVERERMSIENGWLVYDVGHHTCAGGDEAASYHHEPTCGLEPLDDLTEVLERSGYRKPRLVTTAEELDALPVGSVVINERGNAWQKTGRNWYVAGSTGGSKTLPYLPATVLHEGEEV